MMSTKAIPIFVLLLWLSPSNASELEGLLTIKPISLQKCTIAEPPVSDVTKFLSNTFNLTLNQYSECFQVLAGEDLEPSELPFSSEEVNKICSCQGPKLDPTQKEISNRVIKDLHEKELAKAFKGKFYQLINQIVTVDTFIKNNKTNSNFLGKVPNCQFSYIFDELKKARDKEGCNKNSFDKRVKLAFGTDNLEEAKKLLADEVNPIMQNKAKEGSCLPFKTYVRISTSKEAFSYDTTLLYRDELNSEEKNNNRLEIAKARRINTPLSIHLANLKGEVPALEPTSPEVTFNEILSASEKTSDIGGSGNYYYARLFEAQRDKNPLLKAILSNQDSANKFVEIALAKLCSPDKVLPGEDCRFKNWEDIVDSEVNIEEILLSDENLVEFGKTLNDQCTALAGVVTESTSEASSVKSSASAGLDFLCKEELPKPSFSAFKNAILPTLAKDVPTGDLIFYAMEYTKSEYCESKPEKGHSIKPISSSNKIENYFQPASREISELEKINDKENLALSHYETLDNLTCNIINKNCKEANKADCFKNETLSAILADIDPESYYDEEDPSSMGNSFFLEQLKEKVSELVKVDEREPQASDNQGDSLTKNLLGGSMSDESSDELFAPETGQKATDSPLTSYLAHGTPEDRNTLVEYRNKVESGEIPANTSISIPRRGFSPPPPNNSDIANNSDISKRKVEIDETSPITSISVPRKVETISTDSFTDPNATFVNVNGRRRVLSPGGSIGGDDSFGSNSNNGSSENDSVTKPNFYYGDNDETRKKIEQNLRDYDTLSDIAAIRNQLNEEQNKTRKTLNDIKRERDISEFIASNNSIRQGNIGPGNTDFSTDDVVATGNSSYAPTDGVSTNSSKKADFDNVMTTGNFRNTSNVG
ncbi:MAG: hypothetical protein KC493_16195, partial [Bacteriovoracaceae bacterium]|nr:hypothetical protein [Bacteriovoracaceae bacterium]